MSANTLRLAMRQTNPDADRLIVLDTWTLRLTRGYTDFHATGQATAIRVGHIHAWVREHRQRHAPSFLTSSNARITEKANGAPGVEVLVLAAPRHHWDRIARIVAEADTLNRPVIKHARWTLKTAPASKAWGWA